MTKMRQKVKPDNGHRRLAQLLHSLGGMVVPTPRTDKMRLDWLIEESATVGFSRDGDDCWVHWPYGKGGDGTQGDDSENQDGVFDSPRQAIDAAIRAGERNKI